MRIYYILASLNIAYYISLDLLFYPKSAFLQLSPGEVRDTRI